MLLRPWFVWLTYRGVVSTAGGFPALQGMLAHFPPRLKKSINKRSQARTGQENQRREDKHYYNEGQKPPLLLFSQKGPQFGDKALFAGSGRYLFKLAYVLALHIKNPLSIDEGSY